MKLKIFTDLNLIDKGWPVELLIPFIGLFNQEDVSGAVMFGRFDKFLLEGKEFIELTSIEDCDACLLPIIYDAFDSSKNQVPEILQFLKIVEKTNKPIFIFAGHDGTNLNIPIKNAIIFNSAVSKSYKASNVFSWPHFFEDYLDKYKQGQVSIRKKRDKPVVGFCGYAPPLNLRMGKEKLVGMAKLLANYVGYIQKRPWMAAHSYRARALLGLRLSKLVQTNFKLKSNFAFGPQGQMNTGNTTETHSEFRKNFVNNILESDYTLCVRGIGNNSVRFFETLCCGRIPVFVNTDSALPFDHIINWRELCVWVEEKDIDHIGEKVSQFHNRISEQEFIELQNKLRNLWEEYLSPTGFFKHLYLFLQ